MELAVVAYKASLKKYIGKTKAYVTSNFFTDKFQQNRFFIEENFICKVFEKLETKIAETTENLAFETMIILREMFDENARKKVKELYEGAVKEIMDNYSKYENDTSITNDLAECNKLLIETINNFSTIKPQNPISEINIKHFNYKSKEYTKTKEMAVWGVELSTGAVHSPTYLRIRPIGVV